MIKTLCAMGNKASHRRAINVVHLFHTGREKETPQMKQNRKKMDS